LTSTSRRLRLFSRTTLKELQRFDYRRGYLVGNLASEITNATPALKKRVAEHLDDATRHISVDRDDRTPDEIVSALCM
jgi:hypothetical protein